MNNSIRHNPRRILKRWEKISSAIARRQFLQAVTIGGVSILSTLPKVYAASPSPQNRICGFIKPLQSLPFEELAKRFSQIGYNGVEVPVRTKGYIVPDKVDDQLPRLLDALSKHKLELTILTSDITSMKQPHAERVLRA